MNVFPSLKQEIKAPPLTSKAKQPYESLATPHQTVLNQIKLCIYDFVLKSTPTIPAEPKALGPSGWIGPNKC